MFLLCVPTTDLSLSLWQKTSYTSCLGKAVGETGTAFKKVVSTAKGGVVFLDEAHQTTPEKTPGDDKSFGSEIYDHLVFCMEQQPSPGQRECPVFVFAGYPEGMQRFREQDDGMSRRCPHVIQFRPYSALELAQILVKKAAEDGKQCTVPPNMKGGVHGHLWQLLQQIEPEDPDGIVAREFVVACCASAIVDLIVVCVGCR